ncbi:hypothetical protein [Actinocorallia populi]|uniref:hypothetical protein n=1 Tax=Actinocorallia populi TaxID=2079200 RepID=UPI0013002FF9|nr:hypothetical protein [Actinocorallia populi]
MAQGSEQPNWEPPGQNWGPPGQPHPPQQQPDPAAAGQNPPPMGEQPPPMGGQPPQGPQTPPPHWNQPPPQGGWTPPPFQGPGAPGGAPPFGQPGFGPPGFGPPGAQPPKSNKGVLIAVLSASVALVLVLAVVLIMLAGGDEEKKAALTPQQKSAQAVTKLNSLPGLRYTGTYDASGTSVQADLSVTRAGTASGSLTVSGDVIDAMLLDGDLYVKAPQSFWRGQQGVDEELLDEFADKWAKAPDSLRAFDIRKLLVPAALGQALQQAAPLVPPSGAPTSEPVSGRQAIAFEGSEGQYYVSDAAPYQLVKVRAGGAQVFDFDVAELTADSVGTLYTELKDKVRNGLAGALDPAAEIKPTSTSTRDDCSASGCTIERKYSNTGPTATVTYIARIWEDKDGDKELGRCTRTQSLRAGSSTLECRVTSGGWKSWVRGIRPGTTSRYYFNSWLKVESVSKSKADTLIGKLEAEQQGA